MMKRLFTVIALGALPATALAETTLAECADGIDNDGDGLIDLNDDGCDCGEGTELFEIIYENCQTLAAEGYLRWISELAAGACARKE